MTGQPPRARTLDDGTTIIDKYGILITTVIDATGLLIYFTWAIALLGV